MSKVKDLELLVRLAMLEIQEACHEFNKENSTYQACAPREITFEHEFNPLQHQKPTRITFSVALHPKYQR
jgi:hypothetical protein